MNTSETQENGMEKQKFLYWSLFILVITLAFASPSHAKSKTDSLVSLSDLHNLIDITQDLDADSTAIYINADKSCVCACRDIRWSCTTTSCKKQNRKCKNAEPSQITRTQTPAHLNTETSNSSLDNETQTNSPQQEISDEELNEFSKTKSIENDDRKQVIGQIKPITEKREKVLSKREKQPYRISNPNFRW